MKTLFEALGALICLGLILYSFCSFIQTIEGLMDASSHFDREEHRGCYGELRRLDRVMPAYRFGCWLGQPEKQ